MIKNKDYESLDLDTKEKINQLLNTVWPENPSDTPHNLSLSPQSFYIEQDEIISYAAVLKFTLQSGEKYHKAAGLSCVATDPSFQKEGYGLKVVKEATDWIVQQDDLDIAIFTCHPSLVSFYQKSGKWLVAKNLVLKGNKSEDALSSKNLGVSILYQILKDDITLEETVYLNFSNKEFI